LFFQADYDEIKLQNISYDVILVASWPICHRKTSSKKRHKIFLFWAPPNQNFWLRQWAEPSTPGQQFFSSV